MVYVSAGGQRWREWRRATQLGCRKWGVDPAVMPFLTQDMMINHDQSSNMLGYPGLLFSDRSGLTIKLVAGLAFAV